MEHVSPSIALANDADGEMGRRHVGPCGRVVDDTFGHVQHITSLERDVVAFHGGQVSPDVRGAALDVVTSQFLHLGLVSICQALAALWLGGADGPILLARHLDDEDVVGVRVGLL